MKTPDTTPVASLFRGSQSTDALQRLSDAYTQRAEGRWWIFHWTPAGMIVRLLVSYPDKGAAVHAIGILGYRLVDQPALGEPTGQPLVTLRRGATP